MNDPKELPGLAHFCEHMVFLGTLKYPEQNELWKFLAGNGGRDRAETGRDYTLFGLSVSSDALEGALDR